MSVSRRTLSIGTIQRVWRAGSRGLVAVLLSLGWFAVASAQPFQQARLTTIAPLGAKAGTTVEVTVTGADLDGASALYFSEPGITAERVPDPPPPKDDKKAKKPAQPPQLPIKFKVTVAANVPVGIHDVRVIGSNGVSNPRAFVVGRLDEIAETEPNNDVPQAQKVPLEQTINGAISARTDVDYFAFDGKKGQRVVVHCDAGSIDSQLLPFLQVYAADGRLLAAGRDYRYRDALVDLVLPSDGEFHIRLCHFTYQGGGVEAFYRLTLTTGPWLDAVYPPAVEPGKPAQLQLLGRNLPKGTPAGRTHTGRPLDSLTVAVTPPTAASNTLSYHGALLPPAGGLDGFEYRFDGGAGLSNPVMLTFADAPIVLDNESNQSVDTAQEITLPSCICGRIEKRGDRDWYAFTAKKGDVYVLEGLADRLSSPMDLSLTVRQASDGKIVGEFDDNQEIPNTVGQFWLHTDDPKGRFVAPADGTYHLLVRSRTGAMRGGARLIYCVSIRPERPEFHLLLVGNTDTGGGLTLRRGGHQDISVVCLRHDGFDGPVTLSVRGLPAGVTCAPQVIGPKLKQGALVLSVADNAADWVGPITVQGTATINGAAVVREARAGCIVWPRQQANQPAFSRLARSLCLAVRDKGPLALDVSTRELSVPVGGSATFKVAVKRQMPDFKAAVALTRLTGPAQANGQLLNIGNVNVAANKNDADVKFQVPTNSPTGDYSLVLQGKAKYSFQPDPKDKKKVNVDLIEVTPPVRVTIYNTAAELALANDKLALKPGQAAELVVQLKRLHGYKGEFTIELAPPSDFPVSATAVTVPAGANQAKLLVKAPANAKNATSPAVVVRATAKIGNIALKEEVKLQVTISQDAAPGVALTTTKLLAESTAIWNYIAASQVSGSDWIQPEFDDKAWKTGKAPIGYGESELSARKGTTITETGQTILARCAFDVPAATLQQKGATVRLLIASDNSAVVYLNGVAVDEDSADHEPIYWNRDVTLPATRLKPGRNVLAVRLANTSGSSDAFLDVAVHAQAPVK